MSFQGSVTFSKLKCQKAERCDEVSISDWIKVTHHAHAEADHKQTTRWSQMNVYQAHTALLYDWEQHYLGKTSLPGKERRGTSRPIPGPKWSFLDRTSMGFSAGWVATLTITLLLKMYAEKNTWKEREPTVNTYQASPQPKVTVATFFIKLKTQCLCHEKQENPT